MSGLQALRTLAAQAIEHASTTPEPKTLHPEDARLAAAYLDHIEEHDPALRAEYQATIAADARLIRQMHQACIAAGIATREPPSTTTQTNRGTRNDQTRRDRRP